MKRISSFRGLKTKIGHATRVGWRTGCTVLLFDRPAVCGVDVAGGAPGTRDTELLDPTCLVDRVNAILLAGGSAFGLAAADGAMRFLAERGEGFPVGKDRVPIVPAAVIYDRGVGTLAYPGPDDGYRACQSAGYDLKDSGAVGAGCGATVGKFSKKFTPGRGGLSAVCLQLSPGVLIGALAVVNAFGNVVDPRTGEIVAGATDRKGNKVPFTGVGARGAMGANTTIGAVVTNAELTKSQAKRVAMSAQDGLARSIFPSHTMYDGDTVFAASTGSAKADLVLLCDGAAHAMEMAILKAVENRGI